MSHFSPIRRFLGISALSCAPMLGQSASIAHRVAAQDASWVRSFASSAVPTPEKEVGQPNSLVTSPRFAMLLKSSFRQKQWFWYDHYRLTPTAGVMQTFLGVPGDAVLDDNRFVTVDGCVPHDCTGNRGVLWIDTAGRLPKLIFAGTDIVSGSSGPELDRLWVFTSEKLNWQHLPQPFLNSIHRWITTVGSDHYRGTSGYRYNFVLATIVQPNGVMVDLSPEVFHLSTNSH